MKPEYLDSNKVIVVEQELFKQVPDINSPLIDETGSLIDIINDDVFVYKSGSPIYISFEYHPVTFAYYLPEIIDYQKLFPELSVLEEKPIYFEDEFEEGVIYEGTYWKDEPDLAKQQKYNERHRHLSSA